MARNSLIFLLRTRIALFPFCVSFDILFFFGSSPEFVGEWG